MRVTSALLALIFLAFFAPPAASTAFAQEDCRCKGCGCKGGPGWRGPDGACVSKANLAEICGSPPGAPCVREAATRVCYGSKPTTNEAKPQSETN
jgi:hypothetical protein